MNLHANSSNNTVFADAQGNIAYFHSNFVPRRDPKLDWTKPVDGSDPATEWQGVHSVDETPNVINPKSGWLYNTNNAPWTSSGADSPKQRDYPAYFDGAGENPCGVHAIRVLSKKKDFTPQDVIAAAFDPQMPEMEKVIPTLLKAYSQLGSSNPLRDKLAEPVAVLDKWDYRWAEDSVATTLGVLWGDELWRRSRLDEDTAEIPIYEYVESRASAQQRIDALVAVTDKLVADFGKWQIPWGEINRFQRLTGDIKQPFNDTGASIPVPFTTGRWGSLASFGANSYAGSKKIYGTSGNSFLAIVEFGDTVKARAVTAGGQSGDPKSKHFNDQAGRYVSGDLREVYFYPEQLQGHTERTYHPGDK
jgi:acyl-homoserine-lactone acylase